MIKQIYFICTILIIVLIFSCKSEKKENSNYNTKSFSYHDVVPTDFPKLNIKVFNFPEDSITINKWIRQSKQDLIYLHGWGIWTGLTSFTNQKIPGDKRSLRVFETWLTP